MQRLILSLIVCGLFGFSLPAAASFHTWRISEVYSNPSGTVQFIELHESFGFNGQDLLTNAPTITSTGNSFSFSNLPSSTTAGKRFILATAAFALISGAPTPDYTIPSNFFSPSGDTLNFGVGTDLTTFGALPGSDSLSLNRVGTSGSSFTTATNSPTNFAGAAGSVPEPATLSLLGLAAVTMLARRRRMARA